MKVKLNWSLHTGGSYPKYHCKLGGYVLNIESCNEDESSWDCLIYEGTECIIAETNLFSKNEAEVCCEELLKNYLKKLLKELE